MVRTHPGLGDFASKTLLASVLFGFWATMSPSQVATAAPEYQGTDRVEAWSGRRVLVFAPHPDDEMYSSAGTLALLAAGGNSIWVAVYTNGNAGSNDPSMTLERLAEIRRQEQEKAVEILGIPAENLIWLGHDDGMLEYVDERELVASAAAIIRRLRPHVLFAPDPGAPHEQYHKSDHRAAATITADAVRAARWRLYFPELADQGLDAWNVPLRLLYYSAQPNYTVDTTSVAQQAAEALAANVSQLFPRQVEHYDGVVTVEERAALIEALLQRSRTASAKHFERFRRAE